MRPCTRCTRLIIQADTKKVYVMQDVPDETAIRWKEDNDIADIMMKEAGVDIIIFKNKHYRRKENERKSK